MKNEIQHQISLKSFNSFGIESFAKQYIRIDDERSLTDLFENKRFESPFFVLGGGSNVLFTKDYPGLIVHMAIPGIQHFIENDQVFLTASAGVIWNDLVWYAIEHDFPGMENMALIPGTVGASPIQNIGAYGQELMHIFYSCRAFDTLTGKFRTFSNEECAFSYRDSIFKREHKGRYIICSVTYQLPLFGTINTSYGAIEAELLKRGIQEPSIKEVAEVVSAIRVEKLPDPSTVGNAGSFFKNPIVPKSQFLELQKQFPQIVHYPINEHAEKLAAGWLIEQCGWKGKQVGQVQVWKNQALVITNVGNATGNEIFQIASTIVDDVLNKFGIHLEQEVNLL